MKSIMILMLFLVFASLIDKDKSFLFTGYLVYYYFYFIIIIYKYLLKAIIRIGY